MMSHETTLLPCPICGKKVSIASTENEVGERWWFITRGTYKTTRCNCRLFLESEKFTCSWNDDYSLECRAKLIDKWNTRATHGTLTAEQVREAIFNGSSYASYDGAKYYADGINMQATADELNARAGRTCEPKWTLQGETQTQEFWRCECGNCNECFGVEDRSSFPFKMTIDKVEAPNYCPNCGAKVRDE